MTRNTSPQLSTLSGQGEIDALCDAFEQRWDQANRPSIEQILAGARELDRAALLQELVISEARLRRARGEQPALAEYVARFPSDEAVILAAFDRLRNSDATEIISNAEAKSLRPPQVRL